MKVINRFFFVLALLTCIFSDVRAELRFDDYRYVLNGDSVFQIPYKVERTGFYVYYYDVPDCEQYLYENYGMVKIFVEKELLLDSVFSILGAPARTKSDVSICQATFAVAPERYEEIWDALRQDAQYIYSVQTIRIANERSGLCDRMSDKLYAYVKDEDDDGIDRIMHVADSLNLRYIGSNPYNLRGFYEFEATGQSMYDATTCANIIYEATGIYAQPTDFCGLRRSPSGVFMSDNVKYQTLSDSTCMVLSDYYSGRVDIPEKVVYRYREYKVTSIERMAFACCENLESVSLPSSLISIGEYAFSGSAIKSLYLPSELTSLSVMMLCLCESLESIVIPDGVRILPKSIFHSCSGLTCVILPSGLKSIGSGAFIGCESLASIHLPEGLKTIGDCAFYSCAGLTFVSIPEGVDSIGVHAFYCCTSLSKVVIPQSLTIIGNGAFDGDESLTDVVNLSPKPQKIDDSYYDTFPSRFHATLHVPAGCAEAYRSAEVWCDFANIVEDAATSVNRISADDGLPGDAPWFDLTGRRVDNPASGIYISNGRKVLHGG